MDTLKEEEEQSTTTDDRSAKKATISLPNEIIEDIFSRLPVKSILRFRTLSKPWLHRISDPSFTKLHFTFATTGHRTALLISAYRRPTGKQYLLSAAANGGPVTHLMTLEDASNYFYDGAKVEHLNGLVFFTCKKHFDSPYAFVVNPSTRKIFKLPYPYADGCDRNVCYSFGFNESTNEHKILMIRLFLGPKRRCEIMIFCMSNHSWRKVDVDPPVGFSWNDLSIDENRSSVCVNSVVHLMLMWSFDILAFDLKTEKFSIISNPKGGVHRRYYSVEDYPFLVKINSCIGVVWHDCIMENKQKHIWILEDYENRVWVREIIKFPKSLIELSFPFSVDSVNMDEIIFSSGKFSRNVMSVSVYNKKSRCFKSLQFNLGHQFRYARVLQFDQIRCYVESMLPL